MGSYDYDLFVIGGGSGGVRAARLAAAKGLCVGLAEEYRMGGTCVIRGCVPKKLFSYAAAYAQEFRDSAEFGWRIGKPVFDWSILRAAKNKEIERLSGVYTDNVKKNGVVIFYERAEFLDKHRLCLQNGKILSAKTILIAAGAHPFIPKFIGANLCLTSNEIFDLETLPKQIIIVGGGYIAVEFASILHGLGVKVTLIYRGERMLRHFDEDLSKLLQEALQARGIKIIFNAVIDKVEKVTNKNGGLHVRLSDGSSHKAGQVLLALGRLPNIAHLGLEKVGIKPDAKGAISVNRFMQTETDNIYAIGDVTGRVELTPVAIHEAMCFVKTVAEGRPTAPDYDVIPTAVFAEPELGTVGLTEMAAAKQFSVLEVYRAYFRPLRNMVSGSAGHILMKLLVDGKTQRIVGAHILGGGAAEMIQLLAIAVKGRLTKAVFDSTMALHPSATEELVTMYNPSYIYHNGKRQN